MHADFFSKAYTIEARNRQIAKAGTAYVTLGNALSLQHDTWIKDEIISFFVKTLGSLNSNMPRSRKIIFVDSFFIEKLCSKGSELSNIPDGTYNYDGVKQWGKPFLKEANPMQLDAIVFFQNMQKSHWNLIVVRPKDYTIDSLDSMAMNNEVILVMIY